MNNYVPDPIERHESRIDYLCDSYVDEYTCMNCGKRVDYELLVMSPMGDGPALCVECCGLDKHPFDFTTS